MGWDQLICILFADAVGHCFLGDKDFFDYPAIMPRVSSAGAGSLQKNSETSTFNGFASFERVSGNGHLLPRSISLRICPSLC
jgi:hypothetical protein